jgi:hypothetical protein
MHLSQNMAGNLGFTFEINGWGITICQAENPEHVAVVSVQPMSIVKSGLTILAEAFLAFVISQGDLDKFSKFCKTDLEAVEFINSVLDLPTAKDYRRAMVEKTVEDILKKKTDKAR